MKLVLYMNNIVFFYQHKCPNRGIKKNVKIEEFVLEFEKIYNTIKQKDMLLPSPVLASKLLEASQLTLHDRKIILTCANYNKKDTF